MRVSVVSGRHSTIFPYPSSSSTIQKNFLHLLAAYPTFSILISILLLPSVGNELPKPFCCHNNQTNQSDALEHNLIRRSFCIITAKKTLISYTGVVPSSCVILYYMLVTQFFLLPQNVLFRQTVSCTTHLMFMFP